MLLSSFVIVVRKDSFGIHSVHKALSLSTNTSRQHHCQRLEYISYVCYDWHKHHHLWNGPKVRVVSYQWFTRWATKILNKSFKVNYVFFRCHLSTNNFTTCWTCVSQRVHVPPLSHYALSKLRTCIFETYNALMVAVLYGNHVDRYKPSLLFLKYTSSKRDPSSWRFPRGVNN